jgi:hypothetical protein
MNSEIPNRNENDEAIERSLIKRLARLRSMPVHTTTLDKALAAAIPRHSPSRSRILFLGPIRAIAASALLASAIAVAIMLSASSGPALAEPAQMAQVHQDMVSGRTSVMQVDSISKANQMLTSQSPGAPTLPQMPDSHPMACCMKSVHNKKVACVLLKEEGVAVTLVVASAADMKMPTAPIQRRGGIDYRVQQVGDLSMVMTERNGNWLCLIGQTPAQRLMDMAAQIRF